MATTQGKFGLLQRMHNGTGGYDFYKRMKLAAREVARGETPASSILSQLQSIKRDSERNHNVQMANHFVDWWIAQIGAVAEAERPTGRYKTPEMNFGVRLTPELAYNCGAVSYVTYLWATNLPKLTRQAAGAGLFMLRSELAKDKFRKVKFQILDLRQKRLYEEDCITNQSSSILQADIAQINAMWKDIIPKAA
ncbi:hypothetical protein FHS95_001349 [Sphingomonas naasensis]|uniref:Uncharacterized protein n=1 Tax=Sphingomonas naasensis TaxID=1344951 RepID=A0A4S1W9D3_9SPHN|nr:hypothetical protein [Sphingomonas naasensis]NIJ19680.1 hypothetical protein [Sphingomonas naasensis]TGX37096.1 hypothetical protein E5A74_20545 [Sphingomonas naasensis]